MADPLDRISDGIDSLVAQARHGIELQCAARTWLAIHDLIADLGGTYDPVVDREHGALEEAEAEALADLRRWAAPSSVQETT